MRRQPGLENVKVQSSIEKNIYQYDDTPKSFQQLLVGRGLKREQTNPRPRGTHGVSNKKLLHEVVTSRRVKTNSGVPEDSDDVREDPTNLTQTDSALRIQSTEGLADFAARVNQALPLSGVPIRGKNVAGTKQALTRHTKKLRRMQAAWRTEHARLQRLDQERREDAEADMEERVSKLASMGITGVSQLMDDWWTGEGTSRHNDDDPWISLKATRNEPSGLHDLAVEPPKLKKPSRKIAKTHKA